VLTVGAPTFASGSEFLVEVDPSIPDADRIDATTVNLQGGTVVADLIGPVPSGAIAPIPIVTASSSLVGVFAGLEIGSCFVSGSLDYPGNGVDLLLSPIAGATFEGCALTPNQTAVAIALDEIDGSVPTGDMADVIGVLKSLDEDELLAAYDAIGGEALTAFTTPRIANANQVGRIVSRRLGVVGARAIGSPGTVDFTVAERGLRALGNLLASNDPAAAVGIAAVSAPPGTGGRRFGAWLDGYGLGGDVDGDGNASATDWWGGGALLGFDLVLGESGILGLTGGYARLDVGLDARSLDGHADVFQGGLYGGWLRERFHLTGLARYGYTQFDTSRRIAFGDTIDRRASADFDGHEVGGFLETGFVAFAPGGVSSSPSPPRI
jgi:uncharacterized protein with beta-barrel porin domain